jgi:methionine biosynthesis protein MetW
LDVGCGDGDITEIALSRYEQVYGCDLSERALREAVTRGVRSVCADLNSAALPYKDESFDCVTCIEVLEHVIDPLTLLLELRRILRSHGLLIITTPNIRYFRNIIKLLVDGIFPHTTADTFVWGGGHLHYFTRKDLVSLLSAAGFVRCQFVLNEEQFARSWKRRVLVRVMGRAQFGEWICGGITASAVRG